MRALLFCSCALVLHAQQEPHDLLTHVRAKVTETINRLSRYMCTQTVERSHYELDSVLDRSISCDDLIARPRPAHRTTSDLLRLDVGVGANGEMYSWAGENRFHDQSLSELVREGAISNGSFASFLNIVFSTDMAAFSYDGEKIEDGRRLAGFVFQVSPQTSHYIFSNRTSVTTAYEGTVLVDPKTYDLVRLVIRTKDLPIETGACQATNTLDYKRVMVNDSALVLPAATRLEILNSDGSMRDNRTVFSNCHEFLGESTVSFGAPADEPSMPRSKPRVEARVPAVPPAAIPDGVPFEIALTQNIDTTAAAVGDPIKARLTGPIRDRSSRILAPSGTPVTGRIVEIRHYYGKSSLVLIRYRLESLIVPGTPGGTSRPFSATARQPPVNTVGRGGLMRRDPIGTPYTLRDPSGPAMVFPDPKHDLVIKSGLKSDWVTGETAKSEPAGTSSAVRAARRDPKDILADALAKLAPTLHLLPNYLCTQTIDRAQFEPAGPSPAFPSCDEVLARHETARESTSDRLRLDVAAGVNGEMYSWAGERRFGDRGFDDFIGGGAFSSGTFSSLLKMVFDSETADFSYAGEETAGGRTLTQFRFNVPLDHSHYWFGPPAKRVLTAYSGTFAIDPATSDLVRLAVRTGQLPADTGACEVSETLTYSPVHLDGGSFLLPARANMLVIGVDGRQSESISAFSGCREFVGQSTLEFGGPGAPPAVAENLSAASIPFPPGLPFTIAFATEIDSATAAAGDLINARLVTALRDPSSSVLAPPGAAVTGRILRVRHYVGATPGLKIEFKLETVGIGGVPHPLAAVPAPGALMAGLAFTGRPEVLQPGVGVLYFNDAKRDYVVGKGLLSDWVTDKP
jgi:hypothetical protein